MYNQQHYFVSVDIAMYNTHTKSCELSLLFQANISNTMCRRHLLYNCRTPILHQHGKVWFYDFPELRPVTMRCPQANGWITHTASLAVVGQIFNTSHCSIITNDIRTSPELHGEMQENIDNTKFYIPFLSWRLLYTCYMGGGHCSKGS